MTIKDLTDTLSTMHTVYGFKDEETEITMLRNMQTGVFDDSIELRTVDEATGTTVVLIRGNKRHEDDI